MSMNVLYRPCDNCQDPAMCFEKNRCFMLMVDSFCGNVNNEISEFKVDFSDLKEQTDDSATIFGYLDGDGIDIVN